MQLQPFLFATCVCLLVALLGGALVYFLRQERRSARFGWEEIIVKLRPVDREAVRIVAMDEELESDPKLMLRNLGGMAGLEALEANCDVFVELATYVQRWHPEALPVAEHLRVNARQLRWNVDRLRGAQSNGHGLSSFAEYAYSAANIYYAMGRELLALYERFGGEDLQRLQAAI